MNLVSTKCTLSLGEQFREERSRYIDVSLWQKADIQKRCLFRVWDISRGWHMCAREAGLSPGYSRLPWGLRFRMEYRHAVWGGESHPVLEYLNPWYPWEAKAFDRKASPPPRFPKPQDPPDLKGTKLDCNFLVPFPSALIYLFFFLILCSWQ